MSDVSISLRDKIYQDNIHVFNVASKKAKQTGIIFTVVVLYFLFAFFSLGVDRIAERWNPERASFLALDIYAHKDHFKMPWKKTENKLQITLEGNLRQEYKVTPEWAEKSDDNKWTVTFKNGGKVDAYYFPDNPLAGYAVMYDFPGVEETFTFRINENKRPYVEGYEDRVEELPEFIRQTKNKLEVRPSLFSRIQFTKSKIEIHRFSRGWKYFWFDNIGPLADYSLFGALSKIFSGDRIVEDMSNAQLIWVEFTENELWQHGKAWYALLETIIMAFMGTLIAMLVGFPLAFLAAYNITPLAGVRFAVRRLFDFLRGIDFLVWSLIFLRAFGPGPFTGIFAIAFTDTGTLGKLMSEAIENTEKNQKEGVESTGANKTLQNRFGIIPQILPVFISQSLYYLESNTRGAVIIGAMGAGGIGLQFLGALLTGTDFENVAYYTVLVVSVVIAMDMFSAWLRKKLIVPFGQFG